VGDERPGNGAGDCRFEILCQSATATEPRESTFDNPSAWQNFEALRRVRTLDDFYRPFADARQSLAQFISSIATIGKDMAQPGIARTDRSKNAGGAIAILNAGFVNDESDQVALGVGDDVALTALDSLAHIKAPWATAFCGFSPTGCQSLRPSGSPQRFTLAMPAWVTADEIGRVDPSVNDSSTPSARLQIALQKRPLIDCQSGHDFAGGKVNSKAVTTAGAMCSRVILRVSERNSRLVEFEVIGAFKKTSPKIPEEW